MVCTRSTNTVVYSKRNIGESLTIESAIFCVLDFTEQRHLSPFPPFKNTITKTKNPTGLSQYNQNLITEPPSDDHKPNLFQLSYQYNTIYINCI